MKLFGFLSRAHKPDIDALSALVDGALDGPTAEALESHVAGCAACATELDGLRSVKSMLAALPQMEPARSFRVRLADIEAPARPARAPAGGLLRAMPALAAAAAVVFIGVLATDVSTRDSGGEPQATSRPVAEFAAESTSMDDRALEFGTDGDEDTADNGAAGGTIAGSPEAAEAPAADVAPLPSGASEPSIAPDAPADAAARDSSGESDAVTTEAQQIEASDTNSEEDDGDGNRMGFLVVEIAAGVLAIGAVAIFVASRRRKSEG